MRIILFDCRAYFWVMQNVILDWRRFPKWECGLYLLCGVLGGCGSMGGLIDYVGLWDLCCDLLWHVNGIWFLSGVECMIVWFVVIWADIVQSRLYLGRLWECLFLWLSVWKLCRTLFSDICCWSCMVLWLCGLSGLCALLLIYPSILVWYRWVGVLLIFAPFRFCRKGWMWFNCTLTGKIARYDMIYPQISESTTDFAYCNQEKHML